MSKYFKLIGKKVGKWLVLEHSHTNEDKIIFLKCVCECGKQETVRAYNIASKRSLNCIDCGKIRTIEANTGKSRVKRKPEEHTIYRLYTKYKTGARKRKFEFRLSLNFFSQLIFKNCFYCNIEPSKSVNFTRDAYPVSEERFSKGWVKYNGVDRLDNNKGYTKSNSITCCLICNRAKHSLPLNKFVEWVDRLSEHQLKNKKDINNDI